MGEGKKKESLLETAERRLQYYLDRWEPNKKGKNVIDPVEFAQQQKLIDTAMKLTLVKNRQESSGEADYFQNPGAYRQKEEGHTTITLKEDLDDATPELFISGGDGGGGPDGGGAEVDGATADGESEIPDLLPDADGDFPWRDYEA